MKPKIKTVQHNIENLENDFKNPKNPENNTKHDFEVVYKDFQPVDTVKVILENGAIIKYKETNDGKEVLEEVYKSEYPHTLFEASRIAHFSDEDGDFVVQTAKECIDEYNRTTRKSVEDFEDWKPVQKIIKQEVDA